MHEILKKKALVNRLECHSIIEGLEAGAFTIFFCLSPREQGAHKVS